MKTLMPVAAAADAAEDVAAAAVPDADADTDAALEAALDAALEAVPDAALAVLLALAVLSDPLMLSWFVHTAVKPVAFVHALPMVLFAPDTKFTAAHWARTSVLVAYHVNPR